MLLSPDNRWNDTAMDDLTYTLRQLCLRNRAAATPPRPTGNGR
ncbi:hypothetical protein [Xanthomonas sacchari]|nr:hypothetical protein [Xanthomonas sacchari]